MVSIMLPLIINVCLYIMTYDHDTTSTWYHICCPWSSMYVFISSRINMITHRHGIIYVFLDKINLCLYIITYQHDNTSKLYHTCFPWSSLHFFISSWSIMIIHLHGIIYVLLDIIKVCLYIVMNYHDNTSTWYHVCVHW